MMKMSWVGQWHFLLLSGDSVSAHWRYHWCKDTDSQGVSVSTHQRLFTTLTATLLVLQVVGHDQQCSQEWL